MAQEEKYANTNDADSFVLPADFPQINSYLKRFSLSASARINNHITLLRVHTVAKDVEQLVCFQSGLSQISYKYPSVFKTIVIQYLNNDIIRSNHLKPSEVINWLLDSHIHVLLGHFHQGIQLENNPLWNVRNIENEILRLKFHIGSPSGMKVHDPVLLQDKFNYMAAMKQFTLPTLKIPLVHGDYEGLHGLVQQFCDANVNVKPCDANATNVIDPKLRCFVVKLPYSTNKVYRKLKCVNDIVNTVINYRDNFIGVVPYVMLQTYLYNTVEFKIVCFDGKALYEADIANCSKPNGDKRSFFNEKVRFKFAESALAAVKQLCPFIELSSVVRVDIFWCDYLNKMVVNELESLEARIYSKGKDSTKEMFARHLISVYHANRMLEYLSKHYSNKNLELIEYPSWPFNK